MTKDELELWERHDRADEAARENLLLFYLPLAVFWAKRISWSASWANWEDLKQEGVIGLIKAIERFDPSQGVPFKHFARPYIRGAIFDSSELTRNLARQQQESYRIIRNAEAELTRALHRNPTIEEVAEKTNLTIDQIRNAIVAMGVAFAEEGSDIRDSISFRDVQTAKQERAAMIHNALSRLNERQQEIIGFFYWEGLPDKEIAEKLGLTTSNVTKSRQRAIDKLRRELQVKKKVVFLCRSKFRKRL